MKSTPRSESGSGVGDLPEIPEDATPESLPANEDAIAPEAPGDSPPAETAESPAELKDRWLRAEAELQNFRRRTQRNLEDAVRFAEDRLLLETLEQLDDLERALEAAATSGAPETWTQGVRLVTQKMADDLARHGVEPLRAEGARFDPRLHEALLEVDAPPGAEPGTVVQVIRKGYQRNGRALRVARVVVAKPEGA